jgi:hypothetical protein
LLVTALHSVEKALTDAARVEEQNAGCGCEEAAMTRLGLGKLLFCGAAGFSFLLSVSLWFSGSKEQGLFVGLWVPSILSLGALLLAGRRAGQ